MAIKEDLGYVLEGIEKAKDLGAYTCRAAAAVAAMPYAIPSLLDKHPAFAMNTTKKKLKENTAGLLLGVLGGLGLIAAQAQIYYEKPSLLAVPLATNIISGLYEIGRKSKEKESIDMKVEGKKGTDDTDKL